MSTTVTQTITDNSKRFKNVQANIKENIIACVIGPLLGKHWFM